MPDAQQMGQRIKSMRFEDCDLVVHKHGFPRPAGFINPVNGLVYSDERIRVWEMFDIGHTLDHGKTIVRVDIFDAPHPVPDVFTIAGVFVAVPNPDRQWYQFWKPKQITTDKLQKFWVIKNYQGAQ